VGIRNINIEDDARISPDKLGLALAEDRYQFLEDFLLPTIGDTEEVILATEAANGIADTDEYRLKLFGRGEIVSIFVRAIDEVTTAAKTATLTASLNTTAITGAAGAFASADFVNEGDEKEYQATAVNVWAPGDVLKLVASLVTAFVEGAFQIGVRLKRYNHAWFTRDYDGGGVSPLDGDGGLVQVQSGGADNDECYLISAREAVKFQTGKPFRLKVRLKLAEAATDDANILFGVMDAAGANALLDNGGGPAATYDGAVVFKVDGGTVWQCETSNAATQVTTASAAAFVTDTWDEWEIVWDGAGTVSFVKDGTGVADHALSATGLEEMHIIAGVKSGGANAETLKVDFIAFEGTR